ncbi:MAG TPA: M13 family metallopeptidase N-terminal domain-containing protein, partial [Pseudonocardiaceae bacterium]
MNRSRLLAGLLVVLLWAVAACAGTSPPPPLGSGLLLPGYDRSVRPADDLFRFVNGQWLRTTEIPPDRTGYDAFAMLADQTEANLRTIVEATATHPSLPGSEDQQIGDFYASFMDTARLDALGAGPLKDSLARIDALASPADLVRYFGEAAATGVPTPVGLSVDQDAKNAAVYVPSVSQSGLTLPDRDYYLNPDPEFVTIRDQFRAYAARMLGLAGTPDPDGAASRVVALESRLAGIQWTAAQDRDV